MSTPNFIHRPITISEKETTILLLKELTVKEIKELKDLAFQGAQSQTTRIRQKCMLPLLTQQRPVWLQSE